MKDLFLKNRWFLLPYSIFLLICATLLLFYSKAELHILANNIHSPAFDFFFKYYTHIGDGTVIAIVAVVLLFVSYRYFFAFLTGSLSATLLVNLLKRVVFTEMYRPSKYFELYESHKLHLIDGVNLHSLHSFPSGHTAAAFSVFLMLALISKRNITRFLLLIAAVLAAYSRVYISQHFIVDITAGSILSVLFMFFAFYWAEKWKKTWLDNSLINKSRLR